MPLIPRSSFPTEGEVANPSSPEMAVQMEVVDKHFFLYLKTRHSFNCIFWNIHSRWLIFQGTVWENRRCPLSFFVHTAYDDCVVVSVKFYENWLLAMHFVKWQQKWRQQEAIARQSEHVMTLAASVRCRRAFIHWKYCILLHLYHIQLCSVLITQLWHIWHH